MFVSAYGGLLSETIDMIQIFNYLPGIGHDTQERIKDAKSQAFPKRTSKCLELIKNKRAGDTSNRHA